jgi:hypothetical protein
LAVWPVKEPQRMFGPEFGQEAQRQLTVCNACRYCEGFCAVFPAIQLRTSFDSGDIAYLANVCHDCRMCYDARMFARVRDQHSEITADGRKQTY